MSNEVAKPSNVNKSKAQLKAERRARQEAEREAKARGDPKPPKNTTSKPGDVTNSISNAKADNQKLIGKHRTNEEKIQVNGDILASEFREKCTNEERKVNSCFTNVKIGPDEDTEIECIALGEAIVNFCDTNLIWPTQQGANDTMLFENQLISQLSLICQAKPQATQTTKECVYDLLSTSSTNLVKQLLQYLHNNISASMSDVTKSAAMYVNTFITDRVKLSYDAISINASTMIKHCVDNRQQILVYGWSSLVERLIVDNIPATTSTCYQRRTNNCIELESLQSIEPNIEANDFMSTINQPCFVCIIDNMPHLTGKQLVKILAEKNIRSSYALINSIGAVIDKVGACFLSCECVYANGDALVPIGSTAIALTAKLYNKPVLLVAPSHKFADRVGISVDMNANSRYEVLTEDLISGIITEIRTLPPTSAPAIIRVKTQQIA